MRCEHLRVLLDDENAWTPFTELAQDVARAHVPEEVMQGLRLGRMTALRKDSGKARGIVAGSVLRRVVCRAVAAQFGEQFLEETAPHQFALQTRGGAEALVHALRSVTDADADAVICSLDGVGAFGHVRRAALLRKKNASPKLRSLTCQENG